MTKLALIKKGSLHSAVAADEKVRTGTPVSSERLVICLDCSASMKAETRGAASMMHAAVRASDLLIEKCAYTSRVGAVAFSDRIHEEISTNGPRHVLRQSLMKFLSYDGGTTFQPAIAASRKMISREGSDDSLKRIIFLSDGQDSRDGLDVELDACVRERVIIDTVAFGEGAGRELLEHIAKKTGGVMKDAKDAADLVKQFLALEAGIRGLLKG